MIPEAGSVLLSAPWTQSAPGSTGDLGNNPVEADVDKTSGPALHQAQRYCEGLCVGDLKHCQDFLSFGVE